MIEINLSPGAKKENVTKVAGIDLSLLNIKMLIIAIGLVYTYEVVVDFLYEDQIKVSNDTIQANTKSFRQLSSELSKYDAIKKKVKEFDIQEKNLKSKINIVKEIVGRRSNPFLVLKYIAENTPDNVWISELEIDGQRLSMTGQSQSFKKLGDFIENLKSSIFFDGNINYTRPEGVDDTINGIRVEPFKLEALIMRQK